MGRANVQNWVSTFAVRVSVGRGHSNASPLISACNIPGLACQVAIWYRRAERPTNNRKRRCWHHWTAGRAVCAFCPMPFWCVCVCVCVCVQMCVLWPPRWMPLCKDSTHLGHRTFISALIEQHIYYAAAYKPYLQPCGLCGAVARRTLAHEDRGTILAGEQGVLCCMPNAEGQYV